MRKHATVKGVDKGANLICSATTLHPSRRPTFIDYLFVSFTNSTAFSPTGTMPLSSWAKLLMPLRSGSAFVTVGIVAARAVNILGG